MDVLNATIILGHARNVTQKWITSGDFFNQTYSVLNCPFCGLEYLEKEDRPAVDCVVCQGKYAMVVELDKRMRTYIEECQDIKELELVLESMNPSVWRFRMVRKIMKLEDSNTA